MSDVAVPLSAASISALLALLAADETGHSPEMVAALSDAVAALVAAEKAAGAAGAWETLMVRS